jgi:metallo-beta-lactamase family protein
MRVQFLGGARTVTGSATLLEMGSLKWLVDCGMFQGGKELEGRNRSMQPYQPENLSFVLLTHAHIDHSGLIPKLVKEGFQGKVICTRATFDLCQVMLPDSGHIQETEAEWQNRKNQRSGKEGFDPLYTVKDAETSLRSFHPVNYDEVVSLADGVRVRFLDAGHILGSAMIEIWLEEDGKGRKMVFSGDLGSQDQPIIRDPSGIEEADLLWLESTYGDRLHKSREETVKELLAVLQEAVRHQAKVIIPAFAVERTQDIIYTVGRFFRQGLLPSIPIYIDSPLAISATEIFKRNSDCFDQETKDLLAGGADPLSLPEMIYTRSTEESRAINSDPRPGIIISASGMCDSGRIQHHLKHHLWQESSHIVIIGYQAEGTLGRRIVDGAKTVKLFGEEIAVRAHIHTLGGFSAHADQKGLLEWLSHLKNPDLEVFINHGEEKASMELARLIRQELHLKTAVPEWREKRVLFGPEGSAVREAPDQAKEKEPAPPSTQPLSVLLSHLDRNYKRLRRKVRKGASIGKPISDPRRLKQLEEINERIKDLESEL